MKIGPGYSGMLANSVDKQSRVLNGCSLLERRPLPCVGFDDAKQAPPAVG